MIASCAEPRQYFTHSTSQEIQEIETKDHQYCISLGLDFGDDAIKSETYYRCRIILANGKIILDSTLPDVLRRNENMKIFIASLIEKFNDSFENLNDYRNDIINNNQHKICQRMGYNIDSLDQSDVEKYLSCRQRLIKEWTIKPPFNKTQYLKRPSDTYNTGFVINKHKDAQIALLAKEKEKYPICATKLNIKSPEYSDCKKDFDDQKNCYKEAKKLRFAKEMEERMICQKKLYIRFPNSMIKKDNLKNDDKELEKIKILADLYNKNDFYSIGIGKEEFKSFKGEDKNKKNEEKKPEEVKKDDFNKYDELYTRVEITSLRQRFIKGCNDDASIRIENYFQRLNQQCLSTTLKWEK